MDGTTGVGQGQLACRLPVLVSGVSQFVIGQAPARLAVRPDLITAVGGRWSRWNLQRRGHLGTLLALPQLVDGVRALGSRTGNRRVLGPRWRSFHARAGMGLQIVLLVLAVSIPIGVLLAHCSATARLASGFAGPSAGSGRKPHTSEARKAARASLTGVRASTGDASARRTGARPDTVQQPCQRTCSNDC